MADYKPSPRCPYCGGEMEHIYGCTLEKHYYICSKCSAISPAKGGELESYTAAMQRWQEPNVPLTLGELIEYSKNLSNAPIWYEYRGLSEVGCWVNVEVVKDSYCDCSEDEYGKQWRFWHHKPTQEEREAVPWEGD